MAAQTEGRVSLRERCLQDCKMGGGLLGGLTFGHICRHARKEGVGCGQVLSDFWGSGSLSVHEEVELILLEIGKKGNSQEIISANFLARNDWWPLSYQTNKQRRFYAVLHYTPIQLCMRRDFIPSCNVARSWSFYRQLRAFQCLYFPFHSNVSKGFYLSLCWIFSNEKREKVVKASRDITMNSKKVIFQILLWVVNGVEHFCNNRIGKLNKDEVLEKAEKDLQAVRDQHVSRLVKELNGTDFWKLRRAYSPGVQEYVEAATFCKFCQTGTLLNLDEINATFLHLCDSSIEPLQINILDYLLGLADLTGELMRLAISRISDGELDFADKICRFVRDLHRELTIIVPNMDESHDMKFKMDTMLQSVMKIENACFSVHVRGSEYIPMLGVNDPSYTLMGVPDMEL
uniref:Translin-associated protein X n=1 Tax=Chenopodium quinoa TaxID=63459 RepID=A0A803L7N5_CHEQI